MLFSFAACGGKDKASVEDDKVENFSNVDVVDLKQDDTLSAVVYEAAEGTSDMKVGEPNWEDNPTIVSDEADGTSTFKVGEPNWND